MSVWVEKLDQFKSMLEIKTSDHKSSVAQVQNNIRSLASIAAGVQPRKLLDYVLVEPALGLIPEDDVLRPVTIYDIIQYNMIETLVRDGLEHLETIDDE